MVKGYRDTPHYLAPLDESEVTNDFTIVTDRKTLRNIAKDIYTELHHPVTILDINRLGEVSGSKIRIDSDMESRSLRESCKLIRQCAGTTMCHMCDEFHAGIMKGSVENIKERIINAMKSKPSFFRDTYEPPKILDGYKRIVLECRCPILGYRELLFPIQYENKVIGVLFLGQSLVREGLDTETIKKTMEDFFSKPENNPDKIFADYLHDYNEYFSQSRKLYTPEYIKEMIMEADRVTESIDMLLECKHDGEKNPYDNSRMTFNRFSDYERFIGDGCNVLDKLEERLHDLMQKRRLNAFNDVIRNAVQTFFAIDISNLTDNSDDRRTVLRDKLTQDWDRLHRISINIATKLDLNEIILFGDGEFLNISETKLKHLYPRRKSNDPRSKWTYDFTTLEDKNHTAFDYICSIDEPNVLNGLHTEVDKNDVILLVYPDIAIMLKVKYLKENINLYNDMAHCIGANLLHIRSSIALGAANLMKEQHMLTLRMNRHESAHISALLGDNVRQYFSEGGQGFLSLNQKKREHIIEDMKNAIWLISQMTNNIGLLTGSINPNTIKGKETILNVYDLMYKWQVMFADDLLDRNLSLSVVGGADPKLPYFLSNRQYHAHKNIVIYRDLFELLVYNLVDNAVKYAHRGSNITLSWHNPGNEFNYNLLTVSSFGTQAAGDDIYKLYFRGDNAANLTAMEGDGIGLHVVQRAAMLLGLKVVHTCTHVAPYHLPLIEWYINESFVDTAQKEKQMRLHEYKKQIMGFDLSDIVNHHANTRITRMNLSKEYLENKIDESTWLTTFKVSVPKILELRGYNH